ncbi:hypothetical protein LXL04_025423 [Taraxacum kok-saghyz]
MPPSSAIAVSSGLQCFVELPCVTRRRVVETSTVIVSVAGAMTVPPKQEPSSGRKNFMNTEKGVEVDNNLEGRVIVTWFFLFTLEGVVVDKPAAKEGRWSLPLAAFAAALLHSDPFASGKLGTWQYRCSLADDSVQSYNGERCRPPSLPLKPHPAEADSQRCRYLPEAAEFASRCFLLPLHLYAGIWLQLVELLDPCDYEAFPNQKIHIRINM